VSEVVSHALIKVPNNTTFNNQGNHHPQWYVEVIVKSILSQLLFSLGPTEVSHYGKPQPLNNLDSCDIKVFLIISD